MRGRPGSYTARMDGLVMFDAQVSGADPTRALRAGCDVRTGAWTTLERWWHEVGVETPLTLTVEDRLAALTRERHRDAAVNEPASYDRVLVVSGSCAVPPAGWDDLRVGEGMVDREGRVLVAMASGEDAARTAREGVAPDRFDVRSADDEAVVAMPWDVIRHRNAALAHDLERLSERPSAPLPPHCSTTGEHRVVLGEGVEVGPQTVFDTSAGPIVLESGVVVRPRATLIGPLYVGRGSTVLDSAVIRGKTAIGPVCKVNGEVSGCVFQGYANKAHDGFLGDSVVGEWVNLGAGTINSNLLNTYGEVTTRLSATTDRVRTGLTFFGCVLGDHVKTAIGTRIMTGTVIGTGSMIAGSTPPPSPTEAFAWVTDAGVSRYRWNKFEAVMRAAMSRRGMKPSEAYTDAMRRVYDDSEETTGA